MAQAWNKTGGELRLFQGRVQIAIVTASEKNQPTDSKADFILKSAESNPDS